MTYAIYVWSGIDDGEEDGWTLDYEKGNYESDRIG